MTRRFTMFRTARLAFAAGLIALAPGVANAQAPVCSTLRGTYAFIFNGTFPFAGPPAILAPFNGVGLMTFDGAGKVVISQTVAFPVGVISKSGLPANYTLNPDCTGTLNAKDPDSGQSLQLALVVADGGRTIYGIGTDKVPPGSSLSFIFTKIPVTW